MTQINMKEKTSVEMPGEKTIKVDKTRRWTVVCAVGLLGLALVIGATVVGIYVGKNMTQDVYEEAWAMYHNTDTDTVLKQRYIMDGNELSIAKPGEISVILDFDKNQAVVQVDGMYVKATNDCLCFVYDIDPTDFMSMEDVANIIHTGNVDEEGSFPTIQSELQLSGHVLSLNDLSKRSVEMCHGCKILQAILRDVKENTRKRRWDTKGCETDLQYAFYPVITQDDSWEVDVRYEHDMNRQTEHSIEIYSVGSFVYFADEANTQETDQDGGSWTITLNSNIEDDCELTISLEPERHVVA